MKKIFTCSLIFVMIVVGRGQDYIPMLNVDACWGRKYVDNISIPPIVEDRGLYYIFSNVTEVISGIEYTSLFEEYDPVAVNAPIGYLREDIVSQQVFYLNLDEEFSWLNCDGEEILLYDFSAELGDTVYHCPNSNLYYVVQSVVITEEYSNPEIDFSGFGGGRVYEVFSSEFNFSTIYEGVGSNIAPIHSPYNVSVPGNEILANYTFGCAFILDTNDYADMEVIIYPNPIKNVLNIELGEEDIVVEIRIYDVSGQIQMIDKTIERNYTTRVGHLTSGLYFITGYSKDGKEIFNRKFVKMN